MHKEINKKIEKLWAENKGEIGTKLAPLFYNRFKQSGLLFVGCNPSFPEGALRKRLKNVYPQSRNLRKFYNWETVHGNGKAKRELLEIEKLVRGDLPEDSKVYPYFPPLINIAESTGFKRKWEHIDMFQGRHTNQGKFKEQIEINGQLNEFGQKQLEIFESILFAVRPKIILVVNAYVSKIIQENELFKHCIKFDKVRGWHTLKLKSRQPVPIFFSSMVSGQRALDKGSRERLIWHIKKARKYLVAKNS